MVEAGVVGGANIVSELRIFRGVALVPAQLGGLGDYEGVTVVVAGRGHLHGGLGLVWHPVAEADRDYVVLGLARQVVDVPLEMVEVVRKDSFVSAVDVHVPGDEGIGAVPGGP